MDDIILLGAGGHCKSVIDSMKTLANYRIVGILDLPNKVDTEINSIKVIGIDSELRYYFDKGINHAVVTVGSIGDTSLRRKLYLMASGIGYKFPNIIDKTAIVSRHAQIGYGNFIGKGAIINAGTIIENMSIINTGAIIEHDCYIGGFCHIAPGTVISGNASIGGYTHIGTNTTVIQNIKIGSHTVIGAGSVVIKDIAGNKKAYGNPCREV